VCAVTLTNELGAVGQQILTDFDKRKKIITHSGSKGKKKIKTHSAVTKKILAAQTCLGIYL